MGRTHSPSSEKGVSHMFKKLIFWAAIVGGGLFLVNGVWHGSVRTAWTRAEAKKAGAESLRQQLATMKQQKQELEVMAAEYEAKLKELAFQQTRSKMKLDDSRLAQIKQDFEKLREKIEVERKTADLADQFNT